MRRHPGRNGHRLGGAHVCWKVPKTDDVVGKSELNYFVSRLGLIARNGNCHRNRRGKVAAVREAQEPSPRCPQVAGIDWEFRNFLVRPDGRSWLGLTSRRGGIAQDDARNRRTSSRSRHVGTTELLGKRFSIQEPLRHGARSLHELDVSADEFALVAPNLGPAPDPRNRHAHDRGMCAVRMAADGLPDHGW